MLGVNYNPIIVAMRNNENQLKKSKVVKVALLSVDNHANFPAPKITKLSSIAQLKNDG